MHKNVFRKNIVLFIAIIIVIGYGVVAATNSKPAQTETKIVSTPSVQAATTFSYPGMDGKDALTLLKARTSVGQETSGLVSSINNRKADNSKHEYWAFYINGKFASVGPASYITKSSDKIEWKIEKY